MSRIFQLSFSFLNRNHRALISISGNKTEPFIHVQLIDSLFKMLFPCEHIRYKGFEGYKNLEIYKDPFIRKLIDAIACEIEKEFNESYAKVKSILSYFRMD
jgi:hypothetical protein